MKDQDKKLGVVIECLPNLEYKVETRGGTILRCYTAGKLKMNKIRIGIGDEVEYVSDQYGNLGRITWRR